MNVFRRMRLPGGGCRPVRKTRKGRDPMKLNELLAGIEVLAVPGATDRICDIILSLPSEKRKNKK